MSETSDSRFLNNCNRLLDIFKGDAKYNPSNTLLETAKLQPVLDECFTIAGDVPAKLAPQKIKINARQEAYAKIEPFARSSRRYLKSSGASNLEIADANTYVNKLVGKRSTPATPDNPDTPADEAAKKHSVSQLSFDSQLGNLIAYREFLGNVTAYKPNEEDKKLSTVDAMIQECTDMNMGVSAGSIPLLNAWNLRDAKLYNNKDSLFELFSDAKEYYKSLYKPKDPQYRAVTAIELRKGRRR